MANFLQYVTTGGYNGTFVHRSVVGFVIQAGGYSSADGLHIHTYGPVPNEPGISNTRGTIAMAKLGGDPDSATSEWFVNLVDNSANLDFQNGGFTVFGEVIGDGMDVVDLIASLPTYDYSGYDPALTDVPLDYWGYLIEMDVAVIPKLDPGQPSWMTLSVAGNSNPDLVNISLSGSSLNLEYAPGVAGSSQVTVLATDMLGNTIESSFLLTVLPVTVNDPISSSRTPTLSGFIAGDATALEVAVGGATYTWPDGDVVVSGTDWTLALPATDDGDYTVSVAATDDLGNRNDVTGRLLIDTTPPTAAFGEGQLPVAVNAGRMFTGTFQEANIAGVVLTVDDGQGNMWDFTATIDEGAGTWTCFVSIAGLADGVYGLRVTASDLVGHVGAAAGELTVDTGAPVVSTATTAVADSQPGFAGTIDDPAATVVVWVRGVGYQAVSGTDGTWALPRGVLAALTDGIYRLVLTATDAAGNQRTRDGNLVIVDTTPPAVTVNRLVTTLISPGLSGTVNDPGATVVVTVNGDVFNAVNHCDGTWSLPAGTIAPLAQGVYDVLAAASDAVGNVGVEASTGELAIALTQDVVLGVGMSKVTYADADGTAVTITAGRGNVAVSFTGVGLAIAGTGKTRSVTAVGGGLQVDVNVVANSASLTFRTNAGGDGMTAIRRITGAGVLGSLNAAGVILTGGIEMTGAIKTIRLRSVESDIVMGAWSKGVSLTADSFRNCTIRSNYITTLKAMVLSDARVEAINIGNILVGTLSNARIKASYIKALSATVQYRNTNVTATNIGSVLLSNVSIDNGGTEFGLEVGAVKSLRLKQYLTVLTWRKNFTQGIGDFRVVVP